jgi:hypothetical protein
MDAYYKSLVGTFGSNHSYLDWFIYSFYGAIFLFLMYHYSNIESPFKKREWIVISTLLALISIITFVAMYLYATPVGFHYVDDVQGRYFIVVLPFIILGGAQLLRTFKHKLILVGLVIAALFLIKNVFDRYYDYSAGYYNTEFEQGLTPQEISQQVTGHVSLDSQKEFHGLAFSMDKTDGDINVPYLLTIFDDSCSKELGMGLIKTYLFKESALIQVPLTKPFTGQSAICYTVTPLGNEFISNATPLRLLSDPTTERPAAQPLYAY